MVAITLVVALIALGVAGCGVKGPPVAPERRLPRVATDLQGEVEGETVVLTWTNPTLRADGTQIGDLALLKVWRRADPEDAPMRSAMLSWGRVTGYEEVAALRTTGPEVAFERGQGRYVDRPGLGFGRRYTYVVTATDARGRTSAPSERVPIIYIAAPAAPRDLRAEGGEGQVSLRWEPPTTLIDGSPVTGQIGYRVQRAAADGPLQPITAEPLDATQFTDTAVQNDVAYRYAVEAIRVEPNARARGPASEAASVTPVDLTPPSAPTALVAIPAGQSVRLAWNASPDTDVASYAIYRAEGTGAPERVGTTDGGNTVFSDANVQPGRTYRYAVSALDHAARPNESPRSAEVTVTLE
jgi:fibronectin type 3 domain-containing protein